MNICILSMQNVPNYGSLLQAYSLRKLLCGMGHNVRFIDIQPKREDNLLMDNEAVVFSSDSEGGSGLVGKLKKIDRYTINRLRIKNKSNQQSLLMNEFREEYLPCDNNSLYDFCIIGSDEVFNCMAQSPWGFTSQLFGNVHQANSVITYAACCGSTKYSSLPESVREKIRESFCNISGFSVRDKNTKNFVSKFTNQKVYEHLDPVMVTDFSEEISSVDVKNLDLPKRYCIVYSYYNRIHKPEEIKAIQQFCRTNNLEIVTVGSPQKWCKTHLVLRPFEVLAAFSNADYVITDTFHGTIFSAKYASRFGVIIRESNKNKLEDLVNRLHLEQHVLSASYDFAENFSITKDNDAIKEIAINEYNKTVEFLESCLK